MTTFYFIFGLTHNHPYQYQKSEARFILPASANASQILKSQIINEQFGRLKMFSTLAKHPHQVQSSELKKQTLSIRIRRKYEPGFWETGRN